jgi:hypothetical protein
MCNRISDILQESGAQSPWLRALGRGSSRSSWQPRDQAALVHGFARTIAMIAARIDSGSRDQLARTKSASESGSCA